MPPESLKSPTSASRGRPSKLAVVGAGAVGTAVAYAAAIKGDARSIVLYDLNGPKVEAEALDIAHGIQFTPLGAVEGSNDIQILSGSDVVVVTAGAKQKPGTPRASGFHDRPDEKAGSTDAFGRPRCDLHVCDEPG